MTTFATSDSSSVRSSAENISTTSTTTTTTSAFANMDYTDPLRVGLLATVIVAIFIASVVGNALVFAVFYQRRVLLTVSNRFVVNLAASNFLMSVCVMPFVIVSNVTTRWQFGDGLCQITGLLTTLLFSACIFTLLLISLDRYCAVMSPLHYTMRITTKRSTIMIAAVWLVSFVFAVPPVLGWNSISYQPNKYSCTILWRAHRPLDQSYNLFLATVCFAVPFLIMLWAYIRIFGAAKETTARARRNSITPDMQSNIINGDTIVVPVGDRNRRPSSTILITNGTGSRRPSATTLLSVRRRSSIAGRSAMLFHKDDWKAAKTGLIVMSAFFVCWFPYFILLALETTMPIPDDIPEVLESLVIWLALAGCALNPIVYAFRNKTVRHEMRTVVCKRGSQGGAANGGGDEGDLPRRSSMDSIRSLRFPPPILSDSNSISSQARHSSVTIGTTSSCTNMTEVQT